MCILTRRLAFLLRSSMQFAHSFVVQLLFFFVLKPFLSYFINKRKKLICFHFQHTIKFLWRFTKLVSAKEVVRRSFFSFVLVHNKQVMGLLNISHRNDCKRLIKIHSFFVNSEVRNVEICTYFLENTKKKKKRKWLFRGNGMTLTIFPP